MLQKTAIVLFSDDFRIKDNPALHFATVNYENIIPLYIYEEGYLGRELGCASKVFLSQVLLNFQSLLLQEYGVNLIIKAGNYINVISEILRFTKVDAIYFNHSYTLAQIQTETAIKNTFSVLEIKSFKGKLLFEPWEIKPLSGSIFYKVFTPFAKECLKNANLIGNLYEQPAKIHSKHEIKSLNVDDLNLIPKGEGKWFEGLLQHWSFAYEQVETNFINFIDSKLKAYQENRNIPSVNGTSRVSPYLRFGVLSPKLCLNATMFIVPNINNQFVLELLWREFAYHVMFYNQNIATCELKQQYKKFTWENSEIFLQKWQKGETGFDIVDSGMQELWQTGIMHNRIRMVTASFLMKDLMVSWKHGEQWFWNTLVDADPAVNPFSWQWVFGSGFDAAPYFRIFNPHSQREKFDPQKIYCNKWLPKNWEPKEIVSHGRQRTITLERYKKVQNLL